MIDMVNFLELKDSIIKDLKDRYENRYRDFKILESSNMPVGLIFLRLNQTNFSIFTPPDGPLRNIAGNYGAADGRPRS